MLPASLSACTDSFPKVIFFGAPWDLVSFQQGSSRCGRRLFNGRPVPGSVQIVQSSGPRQAPTSPDNDFQHRAGREQMLAFVEDLRRSSSPTLGRRPPDPPCFRKLLFSFLEGDSRTCSSYADATVLCSSCRQRLSRPNPVLPEFLPLWGDQPKEIPHPSVLSKRTHDERRAKVARVRVSPGTASLTKLPCSGICSSRFR